MVELNLPLYIFLGIHSIFTSIPIVYVYLRLCLLSDADR